QIALHAVALASGNQRPADGSGFVRIARADATQDLGGDVDGFVEPTLIAGLDNSARVAQEEIFGPVLVILPHDGDDDAVHIAN
ncbi:aldehyde dehydrogenase family protein, partial [Rhodococcus zopfii]|uniref:aldehyde dehydrogenase family protein n=1 Tax=Rhodococcus zopfii TaxID=43772 RepID=UPI001EE10834